MSATNDLEVLVAAIVDTFHGGQREKMTRPELTRAYGIGRQLLEQVGATPLELRRAARAYQSRYTVGYSLKAVFEHWSSLLAEPARQGPAPWMPATAPVEPCEREKARVRDILRDTRSTHLRLVQDG